MGAPPAEDIRKETRPCSLESAVENRRRVNRGDRVALSEWFRYRRQGASDIPRALQTYRMSQFETLVGVLLVAVVLAAVARKVGAPYPAFLALGGAVLAFLPGTPTFSIDPEVALALFVAPVLLDAAYDASPRDLKDNWVPVVSLAVAVVARKLVPAMPWAAAIALGAIVSPPDAAAAIPVLRLLRPPHRILTILQGESLFNDASALLIYRLAIGAVAMNSVSVRSVAPTLLL